MSVRFLGACLAGAVAVLSLGAVPAVAEAGRTARDTAPAVGPVTGRPLPRFASLKSRSVNMRVGPGTRYPIAWRFRRPGLPVSIVGEHGNWLEIADADGARGWVLHSLLVGRRTALVAPWSARARGSGIARLVSTQAAPLLDAYARPSRDAPIRARLQAGVVVKVEACDTRWCAVRAKGLEMWLPQSALWGVAQNEVLKP